MPSMNARSIARRSSRFIDSKCYHQWVMSHNKWGWHHAASSHAARLRACLITLASETDSCSLFKLVRPSWVKAWLSVSLGVGWEAAVICLFEHSVMHFCVGAMCFLHNRFHVFRFSSQFQFLLHFGGQFQSLLCCGLFARRRTFVWFCNRSCPVSLEHTFHMHESTFLMWLCAHFHLTLLGSRSVLSNFWLHWALCESQQCTREWFKHSFG
jgi:hypothetical protein